MSRTLKSLVVLFVILFVAMFALDFSKLPEADSVTAVAQPAVAAPKPASHTGTAYLPIVTVHRGQAEVVAVVSDLDDDEPVKTKKPIIVVQPCDSRNDPLDNPDPHPCPKRNSGNADEHNAPWPAPEPSPEQPKARQQSSQPTGGKRGK